MSSTAIAPIIMPISSLKDYGNVVEKLGDGRKVYLTKNGYSAVTIMQTVDYEREKEAIKLATLIEESEKSLQRGEKTYSIAKSKKALGL